MDYIDTLMIKLISRRSSIQRRFFHEDFSHKHLPTNFWTIQVVTSK